MKPWMDQLPPDALLNPCSVETLPSGDPITLSNGENVWPVMVSCYQLVEETKQRMGLMKLYMIKVPDISNDSSMVLQFNKPRVTFAGLTGVLDGKWLELPDTVRLDNDVNYDRRRRKHWIFASAHASGPIELRLLSVPQYDRDVPCIDSDELFSFVQCVEIGATDVNDGSKDTDNLCLSINWHNQRSEPGTDSASLVSTYSNGKVAIHDVLWGTGTVQIVLVDSWNAHMMFTQPAEVWSACFAKDGNVNTVYSCGDEGYVKLWDTRSTTRPVQVLKHFTAGATCASQHPRRENIVACGSYDETLCIYDVRYVSLSSKPLVHSKELGGGIWRIKWHPYMDDRVLVAAMHGGCHVLHMSGLDAYVSPEEGIYAPHLTVRETKRFSEHDSMAYGADWLTCKHPVRSGFFEAAVSCSFYDRAVFIWDSVI